MSGHRHRSPPAPGDSFPFSAFFYEQSPPCGTPRPQSAFGSGSTTDTVSADSAAAPFHVDSSGSLVGARRRPGASQVAARLHTFSRESGPSDSCSDGGASRSTDGGHRKGVGYRKLWEQVTKVKEGQVLGKGTAGDFSDMTVEDLVQIVSKLSPKESAVNAVCQGLCYLDSSATAALLKELCKKGLSSRAVEIFDWLRGLDEDHELKPLCDVYTYTTMISQCGSHQQLRTALELVGEMKSRGIKCNVRTYTALMNVCIKVNELDLALDVYRQMQQEDIPPSLVTFNTLIDIYGKKGELENAIEVLDTLESRGVHPEVRTYNTVISACSKSGNPEQALAVYNRMLRKAVSPNATTYTALISAHGKRGQVDKAIEIFNDMIQRGCDRNVITYSSLIGACEKAGRCDLAFELFHQMNQENCRPNAITYNSLIATCANCGRWSEACKMFNRMVDHGWMVDCSTYLAVLGALSHGGPWVSSLNLYEDMLKHNCRPDAVVINAVLETLWQSGVENAQKKAVQLHKMALDKGIICANSHNGQSMEYLVWTCGAAIISLMQWLLEIRKRIGSSPGFPKDQNVCVVMKRGRQCPVAQNLVVIREAIETILSSSRSPFSVLLVDDTIRICAPADHITAWLQTSNFWSCVQPMVSPALFQSSEQIIVEDTAVQDRCYRVFQVTLQYEEKHGNGGTQLTEHVLGLRGPFVKWALGYQAQMHLKAETMHDAILLFDRVLILGLHQNEDNMQLAMFVCIQMIASLCEGHGTDLLMNFPAKAVSDLQAKIQAVMGDEVGVISSLRVVQLYQDRLGVSQDESGVMIRSILQQTLLVPHFLNFPPSVVGAAVLYFVRRARGLFPYWPTALVHMTDYAPSQGTAFADCIRRVEQLSEMSTTY